MLQSIIIYVFLGVVLSTLKTVTGSGDEYTVGVVVDKVIHLNRNNFKQAIEDPANPLWLLKFYAPWCGHCKKLAPVLDNVAPKLVGNLAIGKIDCTLDQKFCSDFQVRGYPTIKVSLDGQIHEYTGGRTESDIVSFGKKMNRPDVHLTSSVNDAYSYSSDVSDNGVIFLCYDPNSKGDKVDDMLASTRTTQVFKQLARQLKATDHFLLLDTKSMIETNFPTSITSLGQQKDQPFLCRIEKNVPARCMSTKNFHEVTKDEMLDFVTSSNFATVTHLGPSNFNKIGRKGRPLVIGVVESTKTDDVDVVKRKLTQYAISGPDAIREKYVYGWMDGKKWAKFLSQFDIVPENIPQFFVLDMPKKTYWQNATYQLDLEKFILAVEQGKVESKFSGPKGISGYAERAADMFVAYMPWSIMMIMAVFILIVVSIFMCLTPEDELRPPYIIPTDHPRTENIVETVDETKKER